MGLAGFFHRNDAGHETPVAVENATEDEGVVAASAGTLMTQAESPEIAKLRAEMAERDRKISDLEAKATAAAAEKVATRVTTIKADAATFAESLVTSSKLMPVGRDHMAALHSFAHLANAGLPTEGFDPVASLTGVVGALVPHNLTAEAIEAVGKTTVVANGSAESGAAEDAKIKAANDRYFAGQAVNV